MSTSDTGISEAATGLRVDLRAACEAASRMHRVSVLLNETDLSGDALGLVAGLITTGELGALFARDEITVGIEQLFLMLASV
jgi:hypothetical protein